LTEVNVIEIHCTAVEMKSAVLPSFFEPARLGIVMWKVGVAYFACVPLPGEEVGAGVGVVCTPLPPPVVGDGTVLPPPPQAVSPIRAPKTSAWKNRSS
jgi:hypothetical protein